MALNLNLRGKLLVVVSISLFIAFGGVAALRIHQSRIAINAEIQRSGSERVGLMAESLASLVESGDFKKIGTQTDRFMKLSDVVQIEILDSGGKILLSRSNPGFAPEIQYFVFSAPMLSSGEMLGAVRLRISLEPFNKAMDDILRIIAVALTFATTLFGLIIYFSISKFVVKPLIRLGNAADQLAEGNFSAELPPVTHDELGNLVRAFSAMRERRKKVENDLTDLNAGLEAIVTARIAEACDNEAYIHAILDNVNEGIIVIGEAGVIVSVNAAAEKIFGYCKEEIVNRNFDVLISNEMLDLTGKYHKYVEEKEKSSLFGVNREVVGRRKDSSEFPLELKTNQIHIQDKLLFITSARDISERKDAEQRISHMANHDALTNLPNRSLLQDRIQQTLAHNQRRKQKSAVLFIDLDKFKMVNDTLGHAVGDILLKETAQRLLSEVRREDTVARHGGDEFIILLSAIEQPQDAATLAQKLLDALLLPFVINGQELHISASIGISIYPDDANDMGMLLKYSDIAMYHAKESGRSHYQFFSPEMNKQAAEKQALSSELRHAITRNELFLVYQPVVNTANADIVGMEVLLRWQHPAHGLISPLKFIPLAEESGLILLLGDWVLRTACQQAIEWQKQGYAVPRLAVNLSAKQFRQKSMADNIASILNETGIEPRYIGFEITESMLLQNIDEVVDTLLKLNNMGLEISIDDFGTGYSSLSYLKRFPINKLKIDKSFVDDIATQPDDAAIVKAIIAMAHGLSLTVVSEGVETQTQLDFLREHGCEQYQGYFFCKPLPAAEIISRLKRQQ